MKATIDLDDALYRRLKVEAARRGRTMRDLVADGVRHVLALSEPSEAVGGALGWFGSLRNYAANARRGHDLGAMRKGIARGRRRRPTRG